MPTHSHEMSATGVETCEAEGHGVSQSEFNVWMKLVGDGSQMMSRNDMFNS